MTPKEGEIQEGLCRVNLLLGDEIRVLQRETECSSLRIA